MQISLDVDMQQRMLAMPRQHPWQASGGGGRYVDLKGRDPGEIEAALEDLSAITHTQGAAAIVGFIHWANGPTSVFETNDFQMRPLAPSESGAPAPLELHGSVSVLFRDLKLNVDRGTWYPFLVAVDREVQRLDPEFRLARWSWNVWPHLFLGLEASGIEDRGACFLYRFWAWGDSEEEVHFNLERALAILREALTVTARTFGVAARVTSADR